GRDVHHPRGVADPRWHGVLEGDAAGAVFPRRQDHRDLRGYERNPAPGHRAQRNRAALKPVAVERFQTYPEKSRSNYWIPGKPFASTAGRIVASGVSLRFPDSSLPGTQT